MSDRRKLYGELYDAFKKAYPQKKANLLQVDVNSYWTTIKNEKELGTLDNNKMKELDTIHKKSTAGLLNFWVKVGIKIFIPTETKNNVVGLMRKHH